MASTLTYEIRQLLKNFGYTAAAVAVLSVSIGINTVMFSGADAVLFRPLPFDDSAPVVHVWSTNLKSGWDRSAVSPPDFADWKQNLSSFTTLSAVYTRTYSLSASSLDPARVACAHISSDLFQTLGIRPRVGRGFTAEEDRPGGPKVTVISDRIWKQYFGRDPDIIGKTVSLNDEIHTIVGLMEPGFWYPSKNVDFWLPLQVVPMTYSRQDRFLVLVGRLKEVGSREAAQGEADLLAARLAQTYPDTNSGWGVSVVRLKDERLSGRALTALFIVLAAVLCVLTIGCANVANLILERVTSRRHEFAIRAALGARHCRLIRHMVAHCAMLSLAGAIGGVALTVMGTPLLSSAIPPHLRDYRDFGFDLHMLGFNLVLPFITSILCAIAPAIQLSRADLVDVLKDGGIKASAGGNGAFNVLIMIEVALSLALMIGTGLAIKGFLRIQNFDWGFRPDGVLTFRIELPSRRYTESYQKRMFFENMLAECRSVPGVMGVSAVDALPLSGRVKRSASTVSLRVVGEQSKALREPTPALIHVVEPRYFDVMGIERLRGRDIYESDSESSSSVAVISESLARQDFPARDPLGQRLLLGQNEDRLVVGIVRSIRTQGPDRAAIPEIYVPYKQRITGAMSIVLHTSGDPSAIAGAVRVRAKMLDAAVVVEEMAMMETVIGEDYAGPRIFIWIMGVFGAFALMITSIGIYSVVSYDVARRTREIGIRMALGAEPRHLYRLVGTRILALVCGGAVIGIPMAAALSRSMSNLLFGVRPFDPEIHVPVTLFLITVGLCACIAPVRRAIRIDPSASIRTT